MKRVNRSIWTNRPSTRFHCLREKLSSKHSQSLIGTGGRGESVVADFFQFEQRVERTKRHLGSSDVEIVSDFSPTKFVGISQR